MSSVLQNIARPPNTTRTLENINLLFGLPLLLLHTMSLIPVRSRLALAVRLVHTPSFASNRAMTLPGVAGLAGGAMQPHKLRLAQLAVAAGSQTAGLSSAAASSSNGSNKKLTETVGKFLKVVEKEIDEETGDDQLGLRDEVKQALEESVFKQVSTTGRVFKFENTGAPSSPFAVSIEMDPSELEYPDEELPEDADADDDEGTTTVPAKIEITPRGKPEVSLTIHGVFYSASTSNAEEELAYFNPEEVFVKNGNGSRAKTVEGYSPAVEFLDEEFQDLLSEWLDQMGVNASLCENLVEFAGLFFLGHVEEYNHTSNTFDTHTHTHSREGARDVCGLARGSQGCGGSRQQGRQTLSSSFLNVAAHKRYMQKKPCARNQSGQ